MTGQALRCHYAGDPTGRPDCELTAAVRYGTIVLCGSCDWLRSSVGKGQRRQRIDPGEPVDVLGWLASADRELRDAELRLRAVVRRARQAGVPWSAIGDRLRISRQAAQQRFGAG